MCIRDRASFEQTVIRLQQMVEERSFVEVRFPGRADNTYQSLILKVDPLERYVLILSLIHISEPTRPY